MKWTLRFSVVALALLVLFIAVPVLAQSYSFSVDREVVDLYIESDGTVRIEYVYVFRNDSFASAIDFVDIGMPHDNYSLSRITGTINGNTITHIADSAYADHGFELGLGSNAIRPGALGEVRATISGVPDLLFVDPGGDNYASIEFSPSWYDSSFAHGSTDMSVAFHMPPGVGPDEPRWHESPRGWPYDRPNTEIDSSGRVTYIWDNPSASPSRQYIFGASFPQTYVPADTVQTPSLTQRFSSFLLGLGISEEAFYGLCCFLGIGGLIFGFVGLGVRANRQRKLDYMPPKFSIEGHGIKRGLSAVEAAVLLETPLDRVLTMILFSVIKKGAAQVSSEDPLVVARMEGKPPDKLRPYEIAFLKAMVDEPKGVRRGALQALMIDLVKAVQKKMKGFSLKETMAYYRSIMKKAWEQVEKAETPEVRSERYGEGLEWTMLDRDFDDRTRRVFRTGPVYVPHWWWFTRPPTARRASIPTPSSGGRGVSLPRLPGSDFAASTVRGVQTAASSMVSNLVDFTNGITRTTNPPPPPPTRSTFSGSSGSSGGSSCACACACAGCACACAGGGR
jgi:hypothetical protein